jgi:Chemotaxis protein CheC, inhibitor of MCP methylation
MNENEIRKDILKELFNISVGKSASILSEIIDKKILLNVPDIEILDLKVNIDQLHEYFNDIIEGALMVSSISFKEKSAGKASLIFPADKMRNFINLCLHEESDDEYSDLNFTDIDFDIIKEVGNIVLNSIIGEIGNYVDIKFNYMLPEVKVFNSMDIEEFIENENYSYILMLYVTFNIENSKIEGAIVINLTLKFLDEILKKIYMMEVDFNG